MPGSQGTEWESFLNGNSSNYNFSYNRGESHNTVAHPTALPAPSLPTSDSKIPLKPVSSKPISVPKFRFSPSNVNKVYTLKKTGGRRKSKRKTRHHK
jgi:hypothetical protein